MRYGNAFHPHPYINASICIFHLEISFDRREAKRPFAREATWAVAAVLWEEVSIALGADPVSLWSPGADNMLLGGEDGLCTLCCLRWRSAYS